MKLSEAKEGKRVEITQVTGTQIAVQALRFGIEEGAAVLVAKNISGGPVIICKNQLEIAIGREIAQAIEVTARD